jgi:hypothetical protein
VGRLRLGSADQLPAFVVAIRSCASAANWNAGPPHGITRVPSTTINNHFFDLLADYNQVSKADITTAGTNRTDRRAKQNATAMYRAGLSSCLWKVTSRPLPPQLLIRKLNGLRYECDMASHSNTRYVFTYRKPQSQTSTQHRLTIPIGPNDLFTVRTGEGYTAFFHEVKANAPEWCAFIGDAHVIQDDDKENSLDTPCT